jgi:type I restriction enzyme M protein
MISAIPMEDMDTKGDVYEYMLSKLSTSGDNGQFRTPRHITKLMARLMKPTPEDVVCDPACGSAGFLVAVSEYLREHYSQAFFDKKFVEFYKNDMFHGCEFDETMISISAMNLMLHGIDNPDLYDRNSLEEDYNVADRFSLVLANPPFKGSLESSTVAKSLSSIVKTKKTELLFLALMLRILKIGGRCAVIVPDGVLFGADKAAVGIRQNIINKQKLEAVISMPSGVFKPYAGVSTAILIFTKTESAGTNQVWFYDMKADGFALDDKRTPTPDNDDTEDIIVRWQNLDGEKSRTRLDQSFFVPADEIRANNYDLSINKYKETVYEQKHYAAPEMILERLEKLDSDIMNVRKELEGMLKIRGSHE